MVAIADINLWAEMARDIFTTYLPDAELNEVSCFILSEKNLRGQIQRVLDKIDMSGVPKGVYKDYWTTYFLHGMESDAILIRQKNVLDPNRYPEAFQMFCRYYCRELGRSCVIGSEFPKDGLYNLLSVKTDSTIASLFPQAESYVGTIDAILDTFEKRVVQNRTPEVELLCRQQGYSFWLEFISYGLALYVEEQHGRTNPALTRELDNLPSNPAVWTSYKNTLYEMLQIALYDESHEDWYLETADINMQALGSYYATMMLDSFVSRFVESAENGKLKNYVKTQKGMVLKNIPSSDIDATGMARFGLLSKNFQGIREILDTKLKEPDFWIASPEWIEYLGVQILLLRLGLFMTAVEKY